MMKRFGGMGKGKKGKRGGFPGLPPGGGFPDLAELTGGGLRLPAALSGRDRLANGNRALGR